MSSVLLFAFYQIFAVLAAHPRILRSPCPDIFHYEKIGFIGNRDWIFPSEDHRWRGVIKVFPSLPISLKIKLLTPAALPSKYVGRVELEEDKNKIVQKINAGILKAIKYYVYFPAQIPLPELILIEVNSRIICSQTPVPRRLKTILTLEHSLLPVTNVSLRGGGNNLWKTPPHGKNLLNEKSLSTSRECGRSILKTPPNAGNASISIGDWPWMVPLFRKTELGLQFLCSSTLISNEFVVTAAHCIKLKNSESLKREDIIAYPGRFDISNWTEENAQPRELSDVFLHPDFDPNTLYSDLALLKFSKPVEFTEKVSPVCLWQGNDDLGAVVGKKGVVFGWGADGLGHKITPVPNLAVMPIVSQEECLRSKMEFLFLTSNRTLCAGFRNGTGPCSGDSGGGLLILSKTEGGGLRWILRGVVSLSLLQTTEIMCDVQEYTVFTDVAKYQDWISARVPLAPNTPIRTPQSKNSIKSLQLTPIWEEVIKNNRLPPEINRDLIFKEISVRLEDLEWPVRQHAFRVLYDIIPVIPREHLDEQISRNNILEKLVVNLGHPAPGIRKVASETIQKFLKRTLLTEKMLQDFLEYGMKEKSLISNNQIGLLRDNITLGTIVTLIDVLKPFVVPEVENYSLSQSLLTDIIKVLVEKSNNLVYREKCLGTLLKIKEMVGDVRFYHTVDKIPERELILKLMNPGFESNWSDRNSFGMLMSQDSFDTSPPEESKNEKNVGKDASSEDFSDGTDTETYTKEPAPNLDDDTIFYHVDRGEIPHYASPSFVPIEHSDNFLPKVDTKNGEGEKESDATNPRVVLEAEIQFAKNKAITMKLMEDENDTHKDDQPDAQRRFTTENGNLVMKVLHNNEETDEEEKTRTPRRVRFGGEVIKLRTPDSDTTDITIEIHEGADAHARKEPIITITPESTNKEEKKFELAELKSQIPAPLALETKAQSRESSPSKRSESSKIPVLKENGLSPKNESFDSALSSSGSEGDVVERWSDDEENAWKWMELRVVEENILRDLKSKENWKIQYQALEQLKIVLINPKTIERIGKLKNQEKFNCLFKCLLHELPQSNNQQVTTLALSIVTQLIESLPKELILLNVKDIVQGLCKYVGGCKNLNLKIEAIQSLKMLFGILEPSAVIDVLVGQGCLFSSSSKLRENSLLAIMYALMTFPSDMFDVEKILEKVAVSTADIRRRVRHGSLEAIAVLSQFCSPESLTENIARVAETLPTSASKTQLIAAVQARLSRRLLPTISTEGLVLYAMQIPASRRFGNLGNPMGADVDWILSGTGSISTGSAKSKTQLNAAQRLEFKSSAPISPSKWSQSERGTKNSPDDNPWKIQKQRTEASAAKSDNQTRFYKTQSTGNLNENNANKAFESNFLNISDSEKRLKLEEITWALVPVSALEEPMGRERSNISWGESFEENASHYLSSSIGPLKPMYLKLQPTQDQLILSRSSDDIRRNSFSLGNKKDLEDFTEIRLLTPTILREKNYSDNYYQNGKLQRNAEGRGSGEIPTRIPVLCSNAKNAPRVVRSGQYGNDRKSSDPENTLSVNEKPTRFNNASKRLNGSSTFLPSIHIGQHDSNYNTQRSPTPNRFGDVDEVKLQDTMTQLSDLLTASKGVGKSGIRDIYSVENQPEEDINGNENLQMNGSDIFVDKIQNKLFERSYHKDHETLPSTVASAPPVISIDTRDQIPSTSSSNSTDFGTLSGNEPSLRRLTNGATSGLPYRNYSTFNPKSKAKKMSLTKNLNKVGNGNPFPDNLKPFERPKEGLDTCFNQLESQQWEVNMLGLTSLVRLLRHHPAIVLSQMHPIIVALGRQIRNLRSQVARVACQASAETFLALKRNVEPDLEELSGPLFHRSADTNRFIRADCNHALDKMVDNVGHVKAVSVIISKGTTHQNATVRAVAARLLLRLAEKAGPEKLLSLPKEIRDKMLQAGANLLIEGKLETRAFAKQVFRVWSSHPSFSNLILEAVQPNVMRHISKTLISLKS